MTIKSVLAVIALAVAPSMSLADCMGDTATQAATSSCAQGSVFDTATGACVPQTNS